MPSSQERLRRLMRVVALGLPLVPALGCTLFGGPCEAPSPRVYERFVDGGIEELDCQAACGPMVDECEQLDAFRVSCHEMREQSCAAGRRPDVPVEARVTLPRDHRPSAVTAWLRDATVLEASSVPAFRGLARALDAHGAPPRLVQASQRAADDERRHTAAMAGLVARRAGAVRVSVRALPAPVPTLFELALANVAEGCVNEAWGAYEARGQARDATEADVRDAMRTIAREEAEHALLSFAIDSWARARLGRAARARLDGVAHDARVHLRAQLAKREAVPALGLASGARSRAALDRYFPT